MLVNCMVCGVTDRWKNQTLRPVKIWQTQLWGLIEMTLKNLQRKFQASAGMKFHSRRGNLTMTPKRWGGQLAVPYCNPEEQFTHNEEGKREKKEKLKDHIGWPKGFKEHHYANKISKELNSHLGQQWTLSRAKALLEKYIHLMLHSLGIWLW